MKWWTGLWVLLFAAAAMAAPGNEAATTRPAAVPPWPTSLGRFAQALLKSDTNAAGKVLAQDAQVRRMDGDKQSLERLAAAVAGARLLGAHAYLYPPLAMGADIAADFKTAKSIPADVKQRMIPVDDDAMKRANATAAQWMGEVLAAKQDDPVGVLILWNLRQQSHDLLGAAAGPQVLFILVKGRQVEPGRFDIVDVVYGNPLSDTK